VAFLSLLVYLGYCKSKKPVKTNPGAKGIPDASSEKMNDK
jgi:hypothetical protein